MKRERERERERETETERERDRETERQKEDRDNCSLEEAQQLFNFLADRMFLKNSPREDKVL